MGKRAVLIAGGLFSLVFSAWSRAPDLSPSPLVWDPVSEFRLAPARGSWQFAMPPVAMYLPPAGAGRRGEQPTVEPVPALRRRGNALFIAAEVAAINVAVWALSHYTLAASYTYLSWETIRENFRDGFEWDRSRYFVNFYHHPYHGSLFFSAGRDSGCGFWGSALATLGGSLMWEMAMENNRPSINDLVTTTFGGCVYGEIGYRFSALVRRPGARGLGRAWREVLGFVLNPIGGLNRLLDRRAKAASPAGVRGGPRLAGRLLLSGPTLYRSSGLAGPREVPVLAFAVDYGDPAGDSWTGRPFDLFSVRGQLRWGPDRPHLSLFISGALFGRRLSSGGGNAHFAGLYQNYEYYGIDTLRVCGTSLTGNWTSRLELSRRARLSASARLGVLGLGGSDDFYSDSGERRSYNFSSGWTAATEAALRVNGHDYAVASWRHYGLWSLAVRGCRPGYEAWDVFQVQASAPLWGVLGVGAAGEHCRRAFDYKGYAPGSKSLTEARAFVSLQF